MPYREADCELIRRPRQQGMPWMEKKNEKVGVDTDADLVVCGADRHNLKTAK